MTRERGVGPAWSERLIWRDDHPLAGVLPSGGAIEPEESTENATTKRRLENLLDVADRGGAKLDLRIGEARLALIAGPDGDR
jgi:hypothetical protein